jgi:hypothetical protein
MTKTNDTKTTSTWETPTVRFVGRLDHLVQEGTGKITVETGDTGEPRKVENKG